MTQEDIAMLRREIATGDWGPASRIVLGRCLDEIERLQKCEEIRLSQVRHLRELDGLVARLQHENSQLRQGIQGPEIERLRAEVTRLEMEVDDLQGRLGDLL